MQNTENLGLVYVTDQSIGIRRVRSGNGFRYVGPDGRLISSPRTLARLRELVIPPAWRNVWICPNPRGHLQATGRDDRARKQYLYHPRWRQAREETKFERMSLFGQFLGKIRRRVRRDLRRSGLPKEKVLAAVVHLLQATLIRVGNDDYVRQNGSFGLTTLRDRHAKIGKNHVHFRFIGKSGIRHEVDLHDRRLAAIVKRCQDLPGQVLFQFEDENGAARKITSHDVNEYIREATQHDFTAKDFRTWAATVMAYTALRQQETALSATAAKRIVLQAVSDVAQQLGNTKTVCRKSYIHPGVIDAYLAGTLADPCRPGKPGCGDCLTSEESALLAFLRRQQKRTRAR